PPPPRGSKTYPSGGPSWGDGQINRGGVDIPNINRGGVETRDINSYRRWGIDYGCSAQVATGHRQVPITPGDDGLYGRSLRIGTGGEDGPYLADLIVAGNELGGPLPHPHVEHGGEV